MSGVKRRFPKSAERAPAITRASIVNARKPPPVPKSSSPAAPRAVSAAPPPAVPVPSSTGLPADFFDSTPTSAAPTSSAPTSSSVLPDDFFDSAAAVPSAKRVRVDGNQQTPTSAPESVAKTAQNGVAKSTTASAANGTASGMVPEGFFDNVDADHRARGLEPPKVDIKEEYKEFQKSIKVDLVAADIQQEEDEEEAADIREELEGIEQRSLMERVEILRKAKEERVAKVKAESVVAFPAAMGVEDDDSEDDEDDEDDIDWRAKKI